MNEGEICARFEKALQGFLNEQVQLLDLDVNERAVGAVLAHLYVKPLFPAYSVDAEYNKVGLHRDPKKLTLPDVCRGGGEKRVFPDIVVHRRGDNDENLLVVELKMQTNKEPRECDHAKIGAFREQLGYRVGVFVDLPAGKNLAGQECVVTWFR